MRRAFVWCLAASVTLAISACGSSDGESLAAAEADPGAAASAETVGGAASGIVDEGDSAPDGEPDGAAVVAVTIDVPSGVELAGVAIVALEDITVADTEAVEIGRVELPASDLQVLGNEVEVFLPLPLDGSIDVTATVHIDVDENGAVSQGDWISPALSMVTSDSTAVVVEIVQI